MMTKPLYPQLFFVSSCRIHKSTPLTHQTTPLTHKTTPLISETTVWIEEFIKFFGRIYLVTTNNLIFYIQQIG